jgi:signal transduction protein with GAF and PtsI domain
VKEELVPAEELAIDFLHEIGSRMVAADPLHQVLGRIVEFVVAIAKCDSCFVYVLESGHLVLRASKNPHPQHIDRLKLPLGQGITGWVAAHRKPVAVGANACGDPRFRCFNELPEDRYEAFLSVPILCRDRLVGVINLQHVQPHAHSEREIQLISTIGFLVGAEIEMARLEEQYLQISGELEARKIVERAKGILQRDMQVSEEEAYLALQKQSRQRRMPMKEVAAAIVMSEEIKRNPLAGEAAPTNDSLGTHKR